MFILAIAAAAVLAPSQRIYADVIYDFTGTPFTSVVNPGYSFYLGASIDAVVTLNAPLPPGYESTPGLGNSYYGVEITSIDIYVKQGNTILLQCDLTTADANSNLPADAADNWIAWNGHAIFAWQLTGNWGYNDENWFYSSVTGYPQYDYNNIYNANDDVFLAWTQYGESQGTWTLESESAPVPESVPLSLLVVGLLVLLLMGPRRQASR